MAKRRCTAKTKKGKRCSRPPMKDGETCLAHADKKTRDSKGFGGAQEGAGRPRVPRITELLTAEAEKRAEEIIGVIFDALHASRGVTIRIGHGEDTLVETPDHATRLAAAKEIQDRVAGRPRQSTEVTGADGGPIEIEGELADPDVKEALYGVARAIDATRRES